MSLRSESEASAWAYCAPISGSVKFLLPRLTELHHGRQVLTELHADARQQNGGRPSSSCPLGRALFQCFDQFFERCAVIAVGLPVTLLQLCFQQTLDFQSGPGAGKPDENKTPRQTTAARLARLRGAIATCRGAIGFLQQPAFASVSGAGCHSSSSPVICIRARIPPALSSPPPATVAVFVSWRAAPAGRQYEGGGEQG